VPEYLAPGVYVEETSFRSKSLEGVGTSTTAFAGLTRRGPVGGTPEILTSFPDFERIYGGVDNLSGLSDPVNYLAHSVRAYFDNGGSRLYVSRAFLPYGDSSPGVASSADITNGAADATKQTFFKARFPGDAGNGMIALRETDTPATVRSMNSAPEGTLLRLGGDSIALPAQITGGAAPFSAPNDNNLVLTVNGADAAAIHFHGEPAEIVATTVLADPTVLDDTNRTLQFTIDGVAQAIQLPKGSNHPADLLIAIKAALVGGTARLTADPKLAIASGKKGKFSLVAVKANATLGFPADVSVSGSSIVANNVGDINRVTADEINNLLAAANVPVHASLSPSSGKLVLTATDTGSAKTLAAKSGGAGSSQVALGLDTNTTHGVDGATNSFYVKHGTNWFDSSGNPLSLAGLKPGDTPSGLQADFITVSVVTVDKDGHTAAFQEMGLDRSHPLYIGNVMGMKQTRRVNDLENGFGITIGSALTAFDLRGGFFGAGKERLIMLTGGNDGSDPIPQTYIDALTSFEKLEDINIVAAPGHSAFAGAYEGAQNALITHAEKRRAYRIAVLDCQPGQAISDVRTARSKIDSSHAAFYFPWVVVPNPLFRPGQEQIPRELNLPPSGFMCGIYARTDQERGVWKAPANEVVRDALRFENDINFGQQEVLNPLGVNCLRFFPGRGYRVWGARTASSDPEWKYVNIRRYFNYLEATIDYGTQWAVFEPNGEALWANITQTVSAFLYNEWVSGALLGATPQEAFFVRCDRSTMTQSDLDNGRLICLVGVAAIKPAEFVIFRIGQKTADAKS